MIWSYNTTDLDVNSIVIVSVRVRKKLKGVLRHFMLDYKIIVMSINTSRVRRRNGFLGEKRKCTVWDMLTLSGH